MKPTIYLVDDDPKFLRSTTRMLESENLPVTAFCSGKEFFQNYRPGSPGCLLLDLMMPEMTGVDVLEKMRELNWMLPTIVMTAFGSVFSAVKAMKLGAIDFVEKPIHRNADLKRLIRSALQTQQPSQDSLLEIQRTGEQLQTLTDREVEILNRVVDGLSSREIAHEFEVSLAAVNSHRAHIMEKLEVNSSQSLIGLVSRYRYAEQMRSARGTVTKTRRG